VRHSSSRLSGFAPRRPPRGRAPDVQQRRHFDTAEFVKVYLAGIKRYGQLSKAGAMIFECIHREISGASGKDKDTVTLDFLAQRWNALFQKEQTSTVSMNSWKKNFSVAPSPPMCILSPPVSKWGGVSTRFYPRLVVTRSHDDFDNGS
jgi:hypothetical protein